MTSIGGSAESLALFSAKTSPWPTPSRRRRHQQQQQSTSRHVASLDYLDIGWHAPQSSSRRGSIWSRRTSLSTVSNWSADAESATASPCRLPAKRSNSCSSASDDYDEIEFIETDNDGEENCGGYAEEENRDPPNLGHRYQSLPTTEEIPTIPNSTAAVSHHAAPPPHQSAGAPPPKLYPNCDATVWLRSCTAEIIEPLHGTQTGHIPTWLHGSLLRNGPGNLNVGAMRFNHLFDSSALLHRFGIDAGHVTYQCRFIQTDTYKRNMAAQRIVVSEFGTRSVPDPCHTIFQRIGAMFAPGEWSDNAMISIYPIGDEYFAFTEYPIIHSIDEETLATRRKLNVMDYTGVMSHTSHPHVLPDGRVFNLGMTVRSTGPQYNVMCFAPGEAEGGSEGDADAMFRRAQIVATVPSRWKLYPGYMHTFGMTERYFVIVEQPLSVSVPEILRSQVRAQPMASNFKWFADQPTCVYLVSRTTGQLAHTFEADAFFYLHIINAYDVGDEYVVVDICCYRDAAMLDCMYVEAMQRMQQNPDYARMFRGRPMRFVLPVAAVGQEKAAAMKQAVVKSPSVLQLRRSFSISSLLARLSGRSGTPSLAKMTPSVSLDGVMMGAFRYRSMDDALDRTANEDERDCEIGEEACSNLVRLEDSTAEAYRRSGSEFVFCKPELLCDLGCETPRIFYEQCMGRSYRYFYAISSDVDAENPGTLIKVDVLAKTRWTWCEKNCYPSEPIFVAAPDCEAEDDGVVLAAMVWGDYDENRVGLLVLCARTWTELGRAEFRTPGPVPKCLHGWFAPAKE